MVVKREKPTELMRPGRFTAEQVGLIKRTIAVGASNDELKMFLYVCARTGLDPFMKQIHFVRRRVRVNEKWEDRMSIQAGIDGLRLIAQRTGEYEGQVGPEWWYELEQKWANVWAIKDPPPVARVGVWRKGFKEPIYSTAKYSAYVQRKQDNTPNRFWSIMPEQMLAKCAEALALRRAFPQELSGIYVDEEMVNPEKDTSDAALTHDEKERERKRLFAVGSAAVPLNVAMWHDAFLVWLEKKAGKPLSAWTEQEIKAMADELETNLKDQGACKVFKSALQEISAGGAK